MLKRTSRGEVEVGFIVPSRLHQMCLPTRQSLRLPPVLTATLQRFISDNSDLCSSNADSSFPLHHSRAIHDFAAPPFFTYIQKHRSNTINNRSSAMRYQDWDVILYPKGCQVPFKEFKTTCYAVQAGNVGGSAGSNGVFAPSDDAARIDLDLNGKMLMFRRCSPDTASHLFRPEHFGRKTLQHLPALVDPAGACRPAGHARSGRQGSLADQDHRGRPHHCVSVLQSPCIKAIPLLTVLNRTQLYPHDCSWPQVICELSR
jgi:hypothetical protein